MVLLVPAEDPSDIVKLDFHLKRNAEKIQTSGSFIAQVNAEFKKEFANSFEEKWGRPDVTLTMPFFSLKGSADVADILKKVSLLRSATYASLILKACSRIHLQCMMYLFLSGLRARRERK